MASKIRDSYDYVFMNTFLKFLPPQVKAYG
jgi:hypothetical protein